MKQLISILAISMLTSFPVLAQQIAPATVHFFNAAAGHTFLLQTTAAKKNPLLIQARTWVIVQAVGDSLGFFIDKKPYSLHFEPGKSYYFVIQTTYSSHAVMTEKSEREFMLTVGINASKGPETYSTNTGSN